ncbi:hypothetical protein DEU56DRAFT_916798 [Suillus clintonianus]|uniref:uncharacterized protein n=1 Tax=Suillus clintonianus TaxID=1904413 RepID=UPI001B86E9AF|nr:uncharacterized protein DEU56DRAFT_916798 [Suillus clintonianus]KAG2124859.1 hypothetical protein DEU56DRAFT_916798 [Suillus clintonianus]
MSALTSSARAPREAKRKALENAVWNVDKAKGGPKNLTVPQVPVDLAMQKKKPAAPTSQAKKKTTTVAPRVKPSSKKRSRTLVRDSDEEDTESIDGDLTAHKKPRSAAPAKSHQNEDNDNDAIEDRGVDSDHLNDLNSDGSDIDEEEDNETPESIASMLFNEVPESKALPPSQYRRQQYQTASRENSKSTARDHKHAAEIPTWADDVAVSDSESSDDSDNSLAGSTTRTPGPPVAKSTKAHLVITESGNVKLLDQNQDTKRVVKRAILEAKCHLVFVDGFPELVDKNQLSHESLLTVARELGLHEIEKRLRLDENYTTLLAALVDARIPILRRELKDDALAGVSGYFRLGHIDTDKAKSLLVQNVPKPISNKPYQGEFLIALINGRVFNGTQSVGVRFAQRFIEITKNKANRPEVPIPIVALVATAVYAALLWKSMGSPAKFSFSGNQFSETYFFHVQFLENMRDTAPRKFHRMMADIYEAVQHLRYTHTGKTAEQAAALELLDIDGMDDDSE